MVGYSGVRPEAFEGLRKGVPVHMEKKMRPPHPL